MPELNFLVTSAQAIEFAATPTLGIQVQVSNSGIERIHTVALRCQIQIEAARRHYTADDQARLQFEAADLRQGQRIQIALRIVHKNIHR